MNNIYVHYIPAHRLSYIHIGYKLEEITGNLTEIRVFIEITH